MATDDESPDMTPGLITRLQDIPGVETVAVDLASDTGSINLRISPDADEKRILSQVHALLVSYGVRGLAHPNIMVGRFSASADDIGLDVSIVPFDKGARIEVGAGDIRSARQVAATPRAIAQGLADAWCQVSGKVPKEVTSVSLAETGALAVVVSDGSNERRGVGDVGNGWSNALTFAVGSALGLLGDNGLDQTRLAPTAW
jgi:hypothetical protein